MLRHTAMDQTGLLLLCVVFPFKSRRLAHVESLGLVAISSAALAGFPQNWGSSGWRVHPYPPLQASIFYLYVPDQIYE